MKELILLVVAPCLVLLLILAWMAVLATRTKSVKLTVRGLGLSVNITTCSGAEGTPQEPEINNV